MVGAFPLSAAVGALPELLPEPAAVGWEPGCWEGAVVAAAVVSAAVVLSAAIVWEAAVVADSLALWLSAAVVSPEDTAEEEAELSAAVVVPSAMVPVLFLKITGVCAL